MNPDILFLVLTAFTLAALFVSLVFVVGIVWRVELELDLSYKFFALAVVFLLAAEILELFPFVRTDYGWLLFFHDVRSL